MLTPLLPLVCDSWIEFEAQSLLGVGVGVVGRTLRPADDSVTGQGRLRLRPREEVSSPSSWGFVVLDDGKRSRERNDESMVLVLSS